MTPKSKLELGCEYPDPGEEQIVTLMVAKMKAQMEKMYAKEKSLRQVHTKMHGCVKAEFIVEKGLEENLKVGVFKEERSYPAWLRLSNGKTEILHDKTKDTRGFSIKLMDVPGEKLLKEQEDPRTQDFILASRPTFFTRNIQDFHGLLEASIKGKIPALFYMLKKWPLLKRVLFHILIKCDHALGIPYFSITPYRFGNESTAVKYHVKPSGGELVHTDKKDPDFLNKSLVATLEKNDIYYDFFIQFQTDPVEMPIEDALVEWKSPFIKVATIRIPAQSFNSDKQKEFGDNLTFNIWHCLKEHRPLGGFNRCRKTIYEAMYRYRLGKNEIPLGEPEANPNFFTNLKSM